MSVQTSQITTASNGDLTIDPNGTGQTKVNSVAAANPGVSIVAMGSDKALKDLDITALSTKSEAEDADWCIIHDSVSGNMMKVSASELGGKPFDPTAANIVDRNGNPFPGAGTQASPFIIPAISRPTPGGSDNSDDIFIINGKPNRIVLFTDESPSQSGTRFSTRPPVLLDASGETSFKLLFEDIPDTLLGQGQTYSGIIKVGGNPLYLSWDVAQQANKTSFDESDDITASPASVNFAADNKYGTLNATWEDGAKTLSADGNLIFSVNGGAKNSSDKAITAGDTLAVSWADAYVASAPEGTLITGNLTATDDTYAYTFSLTKDTTPLSDVIFPIENAPLSTAVETQSRTLFGINAPTTASLTSSSLTSVQLNVAGAGFSNGPWAINPGDLIQAKGTTGGSNLTTYNAIFDVGGVSFTWNVTTVDVDPEVATPYITSPSGDTASPNSTVQSSAFAMAQGNGNHATSDWYLYQADRTANRTSKIVSTNGSTLVQVSDDKSLTVFQVGDKVRATPMYALSMTPPTANLSSDGNITFSGGGGDAAQLAVGDVVSQHYTSGALTVPFTAEKYGTCYGNPSQNGSIPCKTNTGQWRGYTDENAPWVPLAQRPALSGRSGCIWAVESKKNQFVEYTFSPTLSVTSGSLSVECGSYSTSTVKLDVTLNDGTVKTVSGTGPISTKRTITGIGANQGISKIRVTVVSTAARPEFACGINALFDGSAQITVDAIGIVNSIITPGQTVKLINVFGEFKTSEPVYSAAKQGTGTISGISGDTLTISSSNNQWVDSNNQEGTDIFVESSEGKTSYPYPPSDNQNPLNAPWTLSDSSLADGVNKESWPTTTPSGHRYLVQVRHTDDNGVDSDLSNWKFFDV